MARRRAGARRRERQLRGRDDPAGGHAHRRGGAARRGGQRRAVPARSRAREGKDWFYVGDRGPDSVAGRRRQGRAAQLAGANAPSTRLARGRPARVLSWTASSPRPGSSARARTRARVRSATCSATSWTSRPSRCSGASIPTTTTRPTATTAPSRSSRRPRASSSPKLSNHDNHALWGNFKVGYLDNELAHVDRALYGGNLHYETDSTTSFGEKRAALDGFGAEPGTVPSREEFRGTGGSALLPAPAGHPDRLRARADRDARPGLRARDERGAAAAVGGLRHRLLPGSHPALRAAHVDRGRQQLARSRRERDRRRGLAGGPVRVHARLRQAEHDRRRAVRVTTGSATT